MQGAGEERSRGERKGRLTYKKISDHDNPFVRGRGERKERRREVRV